ncbi:MAG: 50S ribosomal protein L40e [Thermoprotei archaeon]|nr:MAG: 50S ribosomal protein L40e [Thermoprotei archaeon]
MPIYDLAILKIVEERALNKKVCRKCGALNPSSAEKCRRCKSRNLRPKKRKIGIKR